MILFPFSDPDTLEVLPDNSVLAEPDDKLHEPQFSETPACSQFPATLLSGVFHEPSRR